MLPGYPRALVVKPTEGVPGYPGSILVWPLTNRCWLPPVGLIIVIQYRESVHRRPKLSMLSFFFPFHANVQANVTYGMYYYITTEFDHAKHDSRLAVYGGVVLQRFEFIKVCMEMQRLCLKSQLFLYFVNKIYLPCCCVVFFVVCQLLGPI